MTRTVLIAVLCLLLSFTTTSVAQDVAGDAFRKAYNAGIEAGDNFRCMERREAARKELKNKYGEVVDLLESSPCSSSTDHASASERLLIFGGRGHTDFLGCLNCSEYDSSSIRNRISEYGWANAVGVWSVVGKYGSVVGSYSACNQVASDPPVIVTEQGEFLGRLSVSRTIRDGVCALGGGNICVALTTMCAGR